MNLAWSNLALRGYLLFVAGAALSALVLDATPLGPLITGSNEGAASLVFFAPVPAALVAYFGLGLGKDEWPVWKTARLGAALTAYACWFPWVAHYGATPHLSPGHVITSMPPPPTPQSNVIAFLFLTLAFGGPLTALSVRRVLLRLERRQAVPDPTTPSDYAWRVALFVCATALAGALLAGVIILVAETGPVNGLWFAVFMGLLAWGTQHFHLSIYAADTDRLRTEVKIGTAWSALPLVITTGFSLLTLFVIAANDGPRGPVFVRWDRLLLVAGPAFTAPVALVAVWLKADQMHKAAQWAYYNMPRPFPVIPGGPPP